MNDQNKEQSNEAITVRDNPSAHRFEAEIDGQTAVAEYRLEDDSITFTHTLVPEELSGRGIGSQLAKAALDKARQRGLKVVAQCSFFVHYLDTHPEYQDLVSKSA